MTPTEIAELRALAEAARDAHNCNEAKCSYLGQKRPHGCLCWREEAKARVAYNVAANPNRILALLDENARLREALEKVCAWGRETPSNMDDIGRLRRMGWEAFDIARAALTPEAGR